MADMTLIRPVNKGQGHSFWYQSISDMQLPIAVNSNFCFRTHRLSTINTLQMMISLQTFYGRQPSFSGCRRQDLEALPATFG